MGEPTGRIMGRATGVGPNLAHGGSPVNISGVQGQYAAMVRGDETCCFDGRCGHANHPILAQFNSGETNPQRDNGLGIVYLVNLIGFTKWAILGRQRHPSDELWMRPFIFNFVLIIGSSTAPPTAST